MIIVFYILLILVGLVEKNTKAIGVLLILFIWVIYGWNIDNPDYLNYANSFRWTKSDPDFYAGQIGYGTLLKYVHRFDIDYPMFRIYSSFVGLLLIYSSLRTYTKSVSFVLALYLIFPFLLDVVQVKTFLSMSVMTFAVRYLFMDKKFAILKYVFLVLVAASLHYMAFFYLFFLLVKSKNIGGLIIAVSFATIGGVLLSYTGILKSLAYLLGPADKIDMWFNTRIGFGLIIVSVIHIALTCLVTLSYRHIKSNAEEENSKFNIKLAEFVYRINIIMWLLFPLYSFNIIFFRIYRSMFLLIFVLFSIVLFDSNISRNKRSIFLPAIIITIFSIAVYYLGYELYDEVVLPILDNNSLFLNN